jgi:methionine-rich copper-binding protein CopC
MRKIYLILILAGWLAAGPAFAHAMLVDAMPAVGGEAHAPVAEIRLRFTEGIEPVFSGIDLAAADGTPVPVTVALDPADDKTLIATPAHPLAPNDYRLQWHVVSVDTHRTQGSFGFTVKP